MTRATLALIAALTGVTAAAPSTGRATLDQVWAPIGPGAVEIRIQVGWQLRKHVGFESEVYDVVGRSQKTLYSVYLGSNPDLAFVSKGHSAIAHAIWGNAATEYTRGGIVTDIVVRLRCGHDRYVWFRRTDGVRKIATILAAMRSVRCVRKFPGNLASFVSAVSRPS